MTTLTTRQAQCLDHVRRSIETRGYAPTLREIGRLMGIRSTNGVNDHLRALERKGLIRRDDMKSRAIVVLSVQMGGGEDPIGRKGTPTHRVQVPMRCSVCDAVTFSDECPEHGDVVLRRAG